jgi:hypothetical protein
MLLIYEAEEDVYREDVNEIGVGPPQRLATTRDPVVDDSLRCFRDAHEGEAEAQQEFGIKVVNDLVGQLAGVLE